MINALTTAKVIVNHFATSAYLTDEDKIKAIQLNINFIALYPEFFNDVMTGPVDLFFGNAVSAKVYALKTVQDLGLMSDSEIDGLSSYTPVNAFEELAAYWRLLKAEGNTVIPYVPIESVIATDPNSFTPKIAYKTRFGLVEGTR